MSSGKGHKCNPYLQVECNCFFTLFSFNVPIEKITQYSRALSFFSTSQCNTQAAVVLVYDCISANIFLAQSFTNLFSSAHLDFIKLEENSAITFFQLCVHWCVSVCWCVWVHVVDPKIHGMYRIWFLDNHPGEWLVFNSEFSPPAGSLHSSSTRTHPVEKDFRANLINWTSDMIRWLVIYDRVLLSLLYLVLIAEIFSHNVISWLFYFNKVIFFG